MLFNPKYFARSCAANFAISFCQRNNKNICIRQKHFKTLDFFNIVLTIRNNAIFSKSEHRCKKQYSCHIVLGHHCPDFIRILVVIFKKIDEWCCIYKYFRSVHLDVTCLQNFGHHHSISVLRCRTLKNQAASALHMTIKNFYKQGSQYTTPHFPAGERQGNSLFFEN